MISYLIMCRSLTYAQRTVRVLERAGLGGYLMRAPKSIAKEGCGYCVKIPEQRLVDSLKVLQRMGLRPKQVYIQTDDGNYSEVDP